MCKFSGQELCKDAEILNNYQHCIQLNNFKPDTILKRESRFNSPWKSRI